MAEGFGGGCLRSEMLRRNGRGVLEAVEESRTSCHKEAVTGEGHMGDTLRVTGKQQRGGCMLRPVLTLSSSKSSKTSIPTIFALFSQLPLPGLPGIPAFIFGSRL